MLDFQEVRKKDGGIIVFTHLQELLMERFGVTTEPELQGFLKGEHYICHCPFCEAEGHTKKKLYITSDYSVGHCFVCGRAWVNVDDTIKFNITVPDFMESTFYYPLEVIKLQDPVWTLDKYYNEFDSQSEKGMAYLMTRHPFMKDLADLLEFKYIDGNVVMPFKYKNEIIYYQIRFTGNNKIRYFFPPISAKPPYIIEHQGENKKFIICEGVYDAISLLIQAPEYTPMAILGSSISDYQMKFLREYVPQEIVIYMDETRISERIRERIASMIDYCPIRIIRSDGTDPEEMMKKRMKMGLPLQWIEPCDTKPRWNVPRTLRY